MAAQKKSLKNHGEGRLAVDSNLDLPPARNTAGLYGQSCAPWKTREIATA
jgi:hypothetical protein